MRRLQAGRPRCRVVWFLAGARRCPFSPNHPGLALGPTQPSMQWLPGAVLLGIKRQENEEIHSPPSSARRDKECVELYLYSLPKCLQGVVPNYAWGQFYVHLHTVNTIDRNFSPTTLIASLISITVENVATVQGVLTVITTSDHFPLLQTQSQNSRKGYS